jgi:hypothetical protein
MQQINDENQQQSYPNLLLFLAAFFCCAAFLLFSIYHYCGQPADSQLRAILAIIVEALIVFLTLYFLFQHIGKQHPVEGKPYRHAYLTTIITSTIVFILLAFVYCNRYLSDQLDTPLVYTFSW